MPRYGMAKFAQKGAREKAAVATGDKLAEDVMHQMTEQMGVFKDRLEAFALKYKKDVGKNPEFRRDFQRMCSRIGVDPLASNKGFWSELLGVGDFYYELGVEVVEASRNGGIVDLEELCRMVNKRRGKLAQPASLDDLERAIQKLKVLGSGFQLLTVGGRKAVQTVPMELNSDQTKVLSEASEGSGHTNVTALCSRLGWKVERCHNTMNQMVGSGLAWVDDQGNEREFWFPGLLRR